MEQPRFELPPSLRPPAGGDVVSVTWHADLGPGVRVGDLAAHLKDLDTAVSIGERWGLDIARESARQVLMDRVIREGPEVLEGERFGYSQRDLFAELDDVETWLYTGRRFWGPAYPWDLVKTIADTRTPETLGAPTEVQRAEYRNPLEVVLGGSGFLILGTVHAMRVVRDWSTARRIGASVAREAEASARRAEASARDAEARSKLFRWLVTETMAGRIPVPPGDLLDAVTHDEATALDRLASSNVTLELPQGMNPDDEQPSREV